MDAFRQRNRRTSLKIVSRTSITTATTSGHEVQAFDEFAPISAEKVFKLQRSHPEERPV